MERFTDAGLTPEAYLRAALRRPALFARSPATVARNVEGVVGHFASKGLTLRAYLDAALKKPSLFTQSPAAICGNVEGVVNRFASAGLAAEDYLRAALKQPALFYLAPATVSGNIQGVVNRFAKDGLTLERYLPAAVKQPSLFTQSPTTIAGHVLWVIRLYRQGMVRFPDQGAHPDGSLRPLFDFLLKYPYLLVLADDNFALREVFARTVGAKPNTHLLLMPRKQVEARLAAALGHPDLSTPVPPSLPADPEHLLGASARARHALLLKLIREGLIKGSTIEQ